jgi:hypothetical protein
MNCLGMPTAEDSKTSTGLADERELAGVVARLRLAGLEAAVDDTLSFIAALFGSSWVGCRRHDEKRFIREGLGKGLKKKISDKETVPLLSACFYTTHLTGGCGTVAKPRDLEVIATRRICMNKHVEMGLSKHGMGEVVLDHGQL